MKKGTRATGAPCAPAVSLGLGGGAHSAPYALCQWRATDRGQSGILVGAISIAKQTAGLPLGIPAGSSYPLPEGEGACPCMPSG